jgi:hypothetical protein
MKRLAGVLSMITVHAWESINETFEARASEWALACVMFSLGVVSAVNEDLFASSNAFGVLARWATQETWALIFLSVGFVRLCVLFVNGGYWRTPHFRSALAFASCFVWFQLVLGFAPNVSFLLATMPWVFLLDAYNALRSAREAGIAQYLHMSKKSTRNGRSAQLTQP